MAARAFSTTGFSTGSMAMTAQGSLDTALGVTLRRRVISTVDSGSSSRLSSLDLGAPRRDPRAVASAMGVGAQSVANPRPGYASVGGSCGLTGDAGL